MIKFVPPWSANWQQICCAGPDLIEAMVAVLTLHLPRQQASYFVCSMPIGEQGGSSDQWTLSLGLICLFHAPNCFTVHLGLPLKRSICTLLICQ